jgi:hypothetical protein
MMAEPCPVSFDSTVTWREEEERKTGKRANRAGKLEMKPVIMVDRDDEGVIL